MTLDGWCDRLARVYPDPDRAAEVALTLAESNAGRRRPRVRDAVDVIRHGLAARLGGRAAGRATRWADAASVAVVLLLVVQAVAAVAVVARAYLVPSPFPGAELVRNSWASWPQFYPPFGDEQTAALGLAAALVAVGAATAACLGRVHLTRVLAVAAAAGGLAAFGLESAHGPAVAFRSIPGVLVVAVGVAAVAAVLFTGAVARAASAVPPVTWVFAGQAALFGAFAGLTVHQGYATPGWYMGRVAMPAAAYAAAAFAIGVVALVAAWRAPALAGGAALVMLAMVPFAWTLPPLEALSGTYYGALYAALYVVPLIALAVLAKRRAMVD